MSGAFGFPSIINGRSLESPVMNADGFTSWACVLRYPTSPSLPPARLAARRYASLRSREILLGEPFGLPPPLQLAGMLPGMPRGLGFSKSFCKGVLVFDPFGL